jgi:ABC-type uncharacterized transport system permease subunit
VTRTLLSIACHAYGLAAVVYLVHLVRQAGWLAVSGRVLVGGALGVHGVALVMQFTDQGGVPVGMSQGLSLLTFLLLTVMLFVDLVWRRSVIGAFVLPVAVAVMVPAFIVPAAEAPLPEALRGPLLPVHISIAILGVATFAVAAGVGVMYVLMERQMKGKHFGLLFSRLPPLQVMDEINRWLVVVGFIALSVTLATGALFQTGASVWSWDPKRVATLVGWHIFAALLGARLFAGWRGKRVAWVTLAGFGVLVVSFLSAYDLGSAAGGS